MAKRILETRERVVDDNEPTQVVEHTREPSESAPNTAARVVWFITGVLLTLLAFRFLLSLLGANRENPFADMIYSITYPFVVPFFGLFGYEVEYGVSRFEIETIVAGLVYLMIGYGIVRLLTINRRDRTV